MKYEELDFFEFFESEPTYLFEKEAGICSYSYEKDDFKIRASLSCYEDYMRVFISYKESTVYSGEIRNIEEIAAADKELSEICSILIETAVRNGGKDDATVVMIEV